ncbi:MAG: methyltransferase domain-containing protein [Candidatus Omnitrophica bacterium]|nr:methyltransferase domain-containing protein [Candidatus Omnitrophota bacterium]
MAGKTIYELRCAVPEDTAILSLMDQFVIAEIDLVRVVETDVRGTKVLSVFCERGGEAHRLHSACARLFPAECELTVRRLDAGQWQTRWKQFFVPFFLTPDILVVPSGCEDDRDSTHRLKIDSTSSFGIGTHPTTRSVCAFLRKCGGAYRSFLDIGTGTGILSLVAWIYGARTIVAIDCDRDAVAAAAENFSRNGLYEGTLRHGEFSRMSLPRFDFVAANLLTDDLIREREKIVSAVAAGGLLAVSGISRVSARRFAQEFDERGLSLIEVREDEGWHSFLFRRDSDERQEKKDGPDKQ